MLDMIFTNSARCACSAKLARWPEDDWWSCSEVLSGRARHLGQVGGSLHTERLPDDHWYLRREYPATETTGQFAAVP